MTDQGYCVFTDTLFQGLVPVERNEKGHWVVYKTEAQAEASIDEDSLELRRQFLAGERELEDGIESEDVVCKVRCLPDGAVVDEWGNCFSPSV